MEFDKFRNSDICAAQLEVGLNKVKPNTRLHPSKECWVLCLDPTYVANCLAVLHPILHLDVSPQPVIGHVLGLGVLVALVPNFATFLH